MVRFFVLQIKLHKISLSDVPEKWREAVREELEKGDSE